MPGQGPALKTHINTTICLFHGALLSFISWGAHPLLGAVPPLAARPGVSKNMKSISWGLPGCKVGESTDRQTLHICEAAVCPG